MTGAGEVDLVAVRAPRREAALAISRAWDEGDAVLVLDPAAPEAAVDRVIAAIAPTHLTAGTHRLALPGGIPVASGTRAVVATSGTTGTPKGVELTAEGATAIGHGWAGAIGHDPDDHWLVCVPLHHVAGLAILARARVTGAAVTVHDTFDLAAVASAPASIGATLVSLVPTMLGRMLDARAPLHEYRRVVTGGAPIPAALRRRAEDAGVAVVDAYGQSETWGGCVANGTPIPGAHVRLGPDDEIEIDGPMVMRDYRRDPEASRSAFTHDGWLRTGDVGRFSPDGRLEVIDRLRDLIITGGVNVSPVEVEHVLAEHPGVADLAVVGGPDPEWGERVVAHVVPRDRDTPPTLADLRAFARDRLPPAELPREVVLLDEVPRSPGGKILRRNLRADPRSSVAEHDT